MKSKEHIKLELKRCEEALKEAHEECKKDKNDYFINYFKDKYEKKIETLKWVLGEEE